MRKKIFQSLTKRSNQYQNEFEVHLSIKKMEIDEQTKKDILEKHYHNFTKYIIRGIFC